MALVQVRDVPEATVRALKAQAAERGLTLTAFLRAELVERLAHRARRGGPTVADTAAQVRTLRESS